MYTELMYGAVLQSYPKLNERYHRTKQPGSADMLLCGTGPFHFLSTPPLWKRLVKIVPPRKKDQSADMFPPSEITQFFFPPSEIFKRSKAPTQPPPQK